ncbi:uveal autoantigen with coiled-coil domains and ankyrin repeats isoform X5 [Camelus ferus]|uniref:Uveal autoantigen with coiled-coil domains and ankyrin repeats isoform X5 n=1 Tax=Camelus ferus TaxID=419612 RepID=A0A8B8S5J6_CAMFR|nr:uveal autoantigen with coiled-coil domains and ankyrin repeats isoform X5 [Camelus ferus]
MMSCWLSCAPRNRAADWNKYDDRLMKAAERGDVEKVSSILAKKGVSPGKLDVEGRSAFHVVASKGNLECLNAILIHGVDITTSDTAGDVYACRSAIRSHSVWSRTFCARHLCRCSELTFWIIWEERSPPGCKVRARVVSAETSAAMADCPSSIQLLCDHGASVHAKDVDGRTPLVLATQMCRPTICQLLIDRGADVNSRDKQNRTALMLGCEYGCKDAVEVLLKNGADVTLLDALGHDSSYYARIGDNLDILTLLKTASENTSRGRELWKKGPSLQQRNLTQMVDEVNVRSNQREHQNLQDLETENEDLKERLRKIQQEQRILLDKVNGLQLQLNEEVMVADDLESEKEKLKSLLTAKEKQHEESLRTIEALRSRFKHFESDHLGSGSHFSSRKEDMLLKQGQMYMTDSQCASPGVPVHMQSRSMLRPLELSLPNQTSYSESEILKKELEAMRTFCDSAKQDRLKLQNELAHKVAECKALALECERVKEDSDEQIKQLEDALKDVQRRMYESEGKVKQMQTHFLALKEHLTSEAAAGNHRLTEELKDQLKDMKAKYEGATAEVGRLREQVRQSEALVEGFRRDEGRLAGESRRLQEEVSRCHAEREQRGREAAELEGRLRELSAQLALAIPAEKFESMKSLLSSEVSEKAKKLAEVEREYERSLSEIRQLKRELESLRARLAQHVQAEEHGPLRSRLEPKSAELGKKVTELTSKNQTLQKEIEKLCLDNKLLTQQVHSLTAEVKDHYVPLKVSEEMKKSHDALVGDLNKKLSDVTQKYTEKKLEMEKLLMENASLSKNVSRLETVFVPPEKHEKEIVALKSTIVELKKQLSELNKKCGEDKEKIHLLISENTNLKQTVSRQHVPVETHEEVKTALTSTLDKTNRELADAKKKCEDINQGFVKIKEENKELKRNLENTQNQIKAEYISLKEHEEQMSAMRKSMQKAQDRGAEALASYQRGQEEIATLHAEIAAQRRELDTIQECIKLKYTPITSLEECERKFKATEKELKEQLSAQTQKWNASEAEATQRKRENEQLKTELRALQKDVRDRSAAAEKAQQAERVLSRRTEELNRQVSDLLQKYTEAKSEKEKLAEENAKQTSEILAAQTRLQKQHVPLEQVEALKKSLNGTIEALREELRAKQRCYETEQQAVAQLQQMLENQKNASVPLAEHLQMKEAFEKEAGVIKASLREKEEESRNKTEEVSKLQAEIQSTKRALRTLETREVVDLSKYKATKSDLETQVSSLNEKLANLNRRYEEACEEALRAKKKERSAKSDKELLHFSIEQEIKDQQERCDKSLTTITELQSRIQESAKQIEAKDNKPLVGRVPRLPALRAPCQVAGVSSQVLASDLKLVGPSSHPDLRITELLNDVERLKQALGGLPQLTCADGSPSKRQSQLVDSLQHQVKCLQQQLADAARQHQEVVAIYRTHLLSAAQGHMDEDVQAALLQIIQMRQGLVC